VRERRALGARPRLAGRLGGLTVADNLQTLCRAHNRWKGRDPVVLERDPDTKVLCAHRVHVPNGFIAVKRWPTLPDAVVRLA
jgi:hypothetical protein